MKLTISATPLRICKKITVLIASICCCVMTYAAELQLKVSDAQGQPITDVVAALVPEQKPVFNQPLLASIDQHNKMFTPAIMAIRTNTLVKFPNSDDIRHHVYSFSPAKKFELRLYHGMTAEPVLFDKPGTVVLGCNIHDSMVAYIFVVDTEYYALSDAQGNVNIQAPAGKYRLQIFHSRLTTSAPEIPVALSDNKPLQQQVKLENLASEKNEKASDEFSGLF
ncbi:MAG: hypothetical protein B0W54_13725 [Cellvibrio sp. 79]|nr:MAG: hypothetical protein B0W54_13725 [Cellvibrio sp. 79]